MTPADDIPREPPARPAHIPVTPDRVRELVDARPGDTIVDGTFGAGGHARLVVGDLGGSGVYVAIDRDVTVTEHVELFRQVATPVTVRFLGMPYPDAFQMLAEGGTSADAVILDIGVSSMQLDSPQRGFMYAHDAPLDMRMDQTAGASAADLVNGADEAELARIIREYGEDRAARRIARAIVRRRAAAPITRTGELVDTIRSALPAGGRATPGGHPAKRTFQALRIAVNDELGMLDRGLDAAFQLLAPGGRLVVMSFHSLEDRIVKRRFERWVGRCMCPPGLPVCACGVMSQAELLTRRAERADAGEVAANPRAEATRLRAIRRRPLPVPAGDPAPGGSAS